MTGIQQTTRKLSRTSCATADRDSHLTAQKTTVIVGFHASAILVRVSFVASLGNTRHIHLEAALSRLCPHCACLGDKTGFKTSRDVACKNNSHHSNGCELETKRNEYFHALMLLYYHLYGFQPALRS